METSRIREFLSEVQELSFCRERSACSKTSPAASDKAVTVGASTWDEERVALSSFGNCTDIFAPGVNIPGPGIGFKFNVDFGGGTSAATPHVIGLIAYFMSL